MYLFLHKNTSFYQYNTYFEQSFAVNIIFPNTTWGKLLKISDIGEKQTVNLL